MARFVFYNLGPGRPVPEVYAEIRNFALPMKRGKVWVIPREIWLVEAIGYGSLPHLPDYEQIRDISRPSRANIAGYILKRPGRKISHRWIDLDFTWPRTEHDGMHPPRSILKFRDGQLRGAVYHAPDPRAKDVEVGHTEGADAVVRTLSGFSGKPLLAVADWNTNIHDDVNGAASVARRLGGRVVGGPPVDHAVVRGLKDVDARYTSTWRGRHLGTDHHSGAFVIDAKVPSKV